MGIGFMSIRETVWTGRVSGMLAALVLGMALILPAQAAAQEVLDRYIAVIGAQDRVNSAGTALTQPAQILAQDRANFHRFGIRQPGDTEDRTFRSTEERGQLARLLDNGALDPAAADAILRGQNTPVLVEVLGSGNRPTGMRVTLAQGQSPQGQPLQALPGTTAQMPSDLAWRFGRYPAGDVSVVSADLYRNADLLVSLRCLAGQGAAQQDVAGIDPVPGRVTLHLAPQVAGSGTAGQVIEAALVLGGQDQVRLPMDWRAPPGAFSTSLALVPGLANYLSQGRVAIRAGAQGVDFAGSAALAEVMPQLSQACMSQAAVAATGCAAAQAGADLARCIQPGAGGGADQPVAFGLPQQWGGQGPASAPGAVVVAGPAPAVPAATNGNDAVQAALFGWALSQHPEATTVSRYQQFVPRMALPPDAPRPPRGGITGPEFEAYLLTLGAYYANKPVPSRIRMEWPANLYPQQESGALRLSSAGRDIDGVHALTDLSLNWRQLQSSLSLRSQKPFYLPLPDGMVAPERERASNNIKQGMVLSVVMSISTPFIERRREEFNRFTADAEIEHVSLIQRTERRVDGKFVLDHDRVILNWTPESGAAMATSAPRPTDPAGMVAVFGGAVSAGRYVPIWDTNSDQGRALGAAKGLINKGQHTRSIETALAFGTLLASGSERSIGADAAQEAIRHVLTAREALDLFPVAYVGNADSMNEIERRAALEAAQPGLREVLTGRMPQLPLQVRDVLMVIVSDYDFTLQGFPLNSQGGVWAAKDPLTGERVKDLVPSFLPMGEAEASQLLTYLAQSGERTRMLYAAVDYTLTESVIRANANGPISVAELGVVQLGTKIDAVTIFADRNLTIPVMQPVALSAQAEAEAGPNPLPDEIFATTGRSLLGAMGRFEGGEAAIGEIISYSRDVARAPAGQRPRLIATITETVLADARDDYWILAKWNLRGFDENAGGYPVNSLQFGPVPHREDVTGFAPPTLHGEMSEGYEVLRIAPERRAAFEAYLDLDRAEHRAGMRLTSNIRVRPVGIKTDKSESILVVSAPVEIMLGQAAGVTLLSDDDRFLIAAPPQLGPVTETAPPITPPEVLILDHEAIDLLAISVAPEVYDDGSYTRMLVERLLKERAASGAVEKVVVPSSVDWGRFFENPNLRMTPPEIARLVPIFREWTFARAAQLPARVAVPLSFDQRWHPDSGCFGMSEVRQNAVGRRGTAVHDAIAQHMPGATLPEDGMNPGQTGPSRAGPDRFWVYEGRAGPSKTRADCGYISRQMGRGSDVPAMVDAPYADVLVRIKAQPTPQGPARASSATYLADLDEVGFAPATPAARDGPGLVGVVTLSVTPVALTKHVRNNVGELEIVAPIGPEDWKVPEAVAPQALDVVGLTLGMPLAEFEAAVREKIPDPVIFEPSRPVEGLFGTAKGFLNPETDEAFLAIYAPALEGQPVISIMRRLEVPLERATSAALRRSLEGKYGPPVATASERHMVWGTLPEREDQIGFCGSVRTVSRAMSSDMPNMTTQQIDRFENEYALPRHGFWSGAGWPQDQSGGPSHAMKDVERCGPVVVATLNERDDSTMLGVLLFDRQLAEMQRDTPQVEAAVEEADIDL